MKHLGDITNLHGGEIPPVDIITFGSPCTRLSVAGKHDGFDISFTCFGDDKDAEKPHYTRTVKANDKYQYLYEDTCPVCGKALTATNESALFFHAVRIIEEMRETTNGTHPTFAVWENVPGAFSSNKGEDFRQVLEELCRVKKPDVHIPQPRNGKWDHAGNIVGDGISLCWRVLDAQYWGVPQRRKRIFLVADFRDKPRPEVLFVPESVFGYPAPCEEAWKVPANDVGNGLNQAVAGFMARQGSKAGGIGYVENLAPTLKAAASGLNQARYVAFHLTQDSISSEEKTPCLSSGNSDRGQSCIGVYTPDVARTLTARHDSSPCIDRGGNFVGAFENHAQDSRVTECHDVAPTVSRKFGTGGNNTPLVAHTLKAKSNLDLREDSDTLIISTPKAFSFDSLQSNSMKSMNPHSGRRQTDVARTIDTTYPDPSKNQGGIAILQKSICGDKTVTGIDCRNMNETGEVFPTLQAKDQGGYSLDYSHAARIADTVRRLTPLECERLQGYPDGWTDLPRSSDSARYKALGNSLAIPCARYVLGAVKYASGRDDLTLGSLFDGIGGFPLAGLCWDITPMWASEIEKFPIEVTKLRFGED